MNRIDRIYEIFRLAVTALLLVAWPHPHWFVAILVALVVVGGELQHLRVKDLHERINVSERVKADPKFADAITRAKQRYENYAEESLWQPKIASGIILNLMKNYSWKQK